MIRVDHNTLAIQIKRPRLEDADDGDDDFDQLINKEVLATDWFVLSIEQRHSSRRAWSMTAGWTDWPMQTLECGHAMLVVAETIASIGQ